MTWRLLICQNGRHGRSAGVQTPHVEWSLGPTTSPGQARPAQPTITAPVSVQSFLLLVAATHFGPSNKIITSPLTRLSHASPPVQTAENRGAIYVNLVFLVKIKYIRLIVGIYSKNYMDRRSCQTILSHTLLLIVLLLCFVVVCTYTTPTPRAVGIPSFYFF